MDTSDAEVDELLECYRQSHQNPQSHDTLGKPLSAEPRPKSQSTAPKGKKRPAEEETVQEGDDKDKEEMDVRDEAQSKRQKRPIEVGGRWQDFEQELELAGATPLVAAATFQFADTALSLRFKG